MIAVAFINCYVQLVAIMFEQLCLSIVNNNKTVRVRTQGWSLRTSTQEGGLR